MSLSVNELLCATWADLENAIEVLVGPDPYQWLFRGHQQASWQLEPRIERECSLPQLVQTELALYDGFRSKAHLYTTQLPPLEDAVSWLATMQHHGIPTRLLDWSYSAYVALFFAIETNVSSTGAGLSRCARCAEVRKPQAKDEYAAVWALHTATLATVSRKLADHMFGFPEGASFESPEHFKRMAFPPAFLDDLAGLVVPILPRFHVSRLSSQQGCFLLNCNYGITFQDSLADMMKGVNTTWLYKIRFPITLRPECLKRLMHFNIHPASLYPDLDGLAKFLTMKNELFPS
jgi:hypothetical protein